MFSGIVEEYAEVVRVVKDQENLHLTMKCSFVDELKIDQSVSHNGVCLTVVSIQDGTYTVTAMKETIERSNIGLLKEGDKVNVERSMMMNGRLDGHIVQGHVDQTAECIDIKDADGPQMVEMLTRMLMLNREADREKIDSIKHILLEWKRSF